MLPGVGPRCGSAAAGPFHRHTDRQRPLTKRSKPPFSWPSLQVLPGVDPEVAKQQLGELRKWLKGQPISRRPMVKFSAQVGRGPLRYAEAISKPTRAGMQRAGFLSWLSFSCIACSRRVRCCWFGFGLPCAAPPSLPGQTGVPGGHRPRCAPLSPAVHAVRHLNRSWH
jgi:hypothetical protein